jgi:type II secretory pathway pseudopilin PulG
MARIQDQGTSLIEVVLSTVILAMLTLVIVGTIVMAQPLAIRFNQKGAALTNLSTAAAQIQIQSWAACTTAQPYTVQTSTTSTSGTPTALTILTTALPLGVAPTPTTTYFTHPTTSYTAALLAGGGNTGSYTWSVTPSLPTGLVMTSAGAISGTPTTEGSSSYKFTVNDGKSVTSVVLNITIISVNEKIYDPGATNPPPDSLGWALCGNSSIASTKSVEEIFLTTTISGHQLQRVLVKTA